MDEARHTQNENESDRKRHNADVRFINILCKKRKLHLMVRDQTFQQILRGSIEYF